MSKKYENKEWLKKSVIHLICEANAERKHLLVEHEDRYYCIICCAWFNDKDLEKMSKREYEGIE